jgi:hypothetical protein
MDGFLTLMNHGLAVAMAGLAPIKIRKKGIDGSKRRPVLTKPCDGVFKVRLQIAPDCNHQCCEARQNRLVERPFCPALGQVSLVLDQCGLLLANGTSTWSRRDLRGTGLRLRAFLGR